MIRVCLLLFAFAFPSFIMSAEPPAPVTLPGETQPDGPRLSIGRPTEYTTTVLAFSPDGKTVAATTNRGYTGGMDAPVHLWDAETGKHLRVLKFHTVGVMAAAFTKDSSILATSGIDNQLRFWDAKTGKDITKADIPLSGHGYNLNFSPDGKRLLVGSSRLEMYDVETQKPIKPKQEFFAETARHQFFHTAAWSPKGKYIAAGCDGGGVRIWEADTGILVRTLPVHYVVHRTRFEFSADDKFFLISTWPKGLMAMYDIEKDKEVKAVDAPKGEVSPESLQFAREMGRMTWVVQKQQYEQGSRTVVVADATGQELKRFEVASGAQSIKISPDGAKIAVGGVDGSLRVYEAETGRLQAMMLGGWSPVYRSVYASAGKLIRVVHLDGLVHDFDTETGKPLREARLDLKTTPHLVSLSADGKLLATASDAGDCVLWNLDEAKELAKPKGKLFAHRERGFGPGGPFPLPPGLPPQPAPPPPPPGGAVRPPPPQFEHIGPPQFGAAFSTDGKLFAAVTGEGNTLTVWDSATGQEKHSLKVPKGTGAVAFSADNAHVFAGQSRPGEEAAPVDPDDKKPAAPVLVRRFELKTGKEVQSWKATNPEKREQNRFSGSFALAVIPLADKETLAVVESQTFMPWPPPPIPAGGRMPTIQSVVIRLISLAGKNPDRVVSVGESVGQVGVSPTGANVAFLAMVLQQQPVQRNVSVARVASADTGKVREAELPGGQYAGPGGTVAFRPDEKELLVTTSDSRVLVIESAKLTDKKPDPKKE